jgi:hypothetical protein
MSPDSFNGCFDALKDDHGSKKRDCRTRESPDLDTAINTSL